MSKKSRAAKKTILEIGLPELPEGQRWYIREFAKEHRYLFLERKNIFGFYVTEEKDMIYTGKHSSGFYEETRNAAEGVFRKISDRSLPTGEAR